MSKRRLAVFIFVFVSFGLMWAVPANDISETAYDESEGVPYQLSLPLVITLNDSDFDLLAAPDVVSCRVTTASQRTHSRRAISYSAHKPAPCSLLCSLRC